MQKLSYIFGLGSVGFVSKFLTGDSSTPVTGIILPILFGLIGGAGGLFLAKVDFSQKSELSRLNLMGTNDISEGKSPLV